MTAHEIPGLRFAGECSAAIPRRRFVVVGTNGTYALAGADARAVGVSTTETLNAGEVIDISRGILMVEASAAIACNANISSAAAGKAVTAGSGAVLGVALTAAAAAGELVAVLLIG